MGAAVGLRRGHPGAPAPEIGAHSNTANATLQIKAPNICEARSVMARAITVTGRWITEDPGHSGETDLFSLPRLKTDGSVPMSPAVFVADNLWPPPRLESSQPAWCCHPQLLQAGNVPLHRYNSTRVAAASNTAGSQPGFTRKINFPECSSGYSVDLCIDRIDRINCIDRT